jgi:hypothetical protein
MRSSFDGSRPKIELGLVHAVDQDRAPGDEIPHTQRDGAIRALDDLAGFVVRKLDWDTGLQS